MLKLVLAASVFTTCTFSANSHASDDAPNTSQRNLARERCKLLLQGRGTPSTLGELKAGDVIRIEESLVALNKRPAKMNQMAMGLVISNAGGRISLQPFGGKLWQRLEKRNPLPVSDIQGHTWIDYTDPALRVEIMGRTRTVQITPPPARSTKKITEWKHPPGSIVRLDGHLYLVEQVKKTPVQSEELSAKFKQVVTIHVGTREEVVIREMWLSQDSHKMHMDLQTLTLVLGAKIDGNAIVQNAVLEPELIHTGIGALPYSIRYGGELTAPNRTRLGPGELLQIGEVIRDQRDGTLKVVVRVDPLGTPALARLGLLPVPTEFNAYVRDAGMSLDSLEYVSQNAHQAWDGGHRKFFEQESLEIVGHMHVRVALDLIAIRSQVENHILATAHATLDAVQVAAFLGYQNLTTSPAAESPAGP